MNDKTIIDALKAEAEGYLRRGRIDRLEQVVASLVALGCEDHGFLSPGPSTVPAQSGSAKPVKKAAKRLSK